MKASIRAKIKDSTQDHLEVFDITDDMIINRSGVISIVIQTTTVNFDLLSEQEQANKISAFSGLLNSLNFQVQVLVVTKRVKISSYIDYLQEQKNSIKSPGLLKQLDTYTEFINKLITENDVLDKKFYITIPFHGKPATTSGESSEVLRQKIIEEAKIFLYPKRDHILKQLNRMGLVGHQLTTNEIIEVLYNMYNE